MRAIAPEAMRVLRDYAWPGNVREVAECDPPVGPADDRARPAGRIFCPIPCGRLGTQELETQSQGPLARSGSETALDRLIDERLRAGSQQLYDEVVGHVESRLIERALELHRRRQAGGDQAAGGESRRHFVRRPHWPCSISNPIASAGGAGPDDAARHDHGRHRKRSHPARAGYRPTGAGRKPRSCWA